MMTRRPYVLFAVVYIGAFGFAWSTIGNLGILTRQAKGDLERFKAFIEQRGVETGAWRGEVDQSAT